ncbi:unnamed protein product [Owenia fusiformis]|uniref:Uncharacterized protein n=1 Tax=Owenia fusiformis TaxID=6347 RepID=A0A8J1XXC0_OWEFU|nr:unnamed protein product [Owenia fusiformis]
MKSKYLPYLMISQIAILFIGLQFSNCDVELHKCNGVKIKLKHWASATVSCEGRCGSHINDTIMSLSCSCDRDCNMYDDCCEDFRDMCPNLARGLEGLGPRFHCGMSLGGGKHVYVIATCPNDGTLDKSLLDKCLSTESKIGLLTTPVVDRQTGYHYRNIFCGICNRINSEQMVAWTINMGTPGPLDIKDMMSILDVEQTGQTIQITYDPYVVPDFPPRICALKYDYCTGECLNATIVEKCTESGGMVVHNIWGTTFKNIYCALCSSDGVLAAGARIFSGYPPSNGYPSVRQPFYSFKLQIDIREDPGFYLSTVTPGVGYLNSEPIRSICKVIDNHCCLIDCGASAIVSTNGARCKQRKDKWMANVNLTIAMYSFTIGITGSLQEYLNYNGLQGSGYIQITHRESYNLGFLYKLSLVLMFDQDYTKVKMNNIINETFSNLDKFYMNNTKIGIYVSDVTSVEFEYIIGEDVMTTQNKTQENCDIMTTQKITHENIDIMTTHKTEEENGVNVTQEDAKGSTVKTSGAITNKSGLFVCLMYASLIQYR